MRWFARPENNALQLRVAPRLASWNKAGDPDQVRLRAYLDDTEALLAAARIDGPWSLRLDVGLPATRDLLDASDLDNFAYPLAYHLRDPGLVSVWCTKETSEQSFVRIDAAREVAPPSTGVLVATTTASASSVAFKEQIYAAVAGESEIPAGPVRLELSFVVGARRNWLNLWKQTIDSLDAILGRTNPNRRWHPRDGRIVELGMHLEVDRAARNEVVVGIAATQAFLEVGHTRACATQPAPVAAGPSAQTPSTTNCRPAASNSSPHPPGDLTSRQTNARPPFAAEIERILLAHQRTRYAKVLSGMKRGLTDAEMSKEAGAAGEPCRAESIAYIRRLVGLVLDDELVPAPSDAVNQAAIYRELLNYRLTPELLQHIMTRLNQLRQLDPAVKHTPLGSVHLGAGDAPQSRDSQQACPHCFLTHSGECF
ncbi:hypothetical protein [Mycobacterium gordonae]|uniref:hypothetical protein n=1 Tax=Mycobacterium gordonae TaxID=1778 RepID=UPI001E54043D|nr:hypothetical protein [Mycobacterium gordonae]